MNRFVICSLVLWGLCVAASAQERNEGKNANTKTQGAGPCVRLLNTPVITVNQATGRGEAILYLRNQTDKEAAIALVGIARHLQIRQHTWSLVRSRP